MSKQSSVISETAPLSTREKILVEASSLFALRGYDATGTRDIAKAVGIRQPSLFYHFESKAEIFADLLSRDLTLALDQIRSINHSEGDGSVAVKLYAYLVGSIDAIAHASTTIIGLYDRDVLGEPQFAEQWELRATLHAETEQLIQQGIDSREFVASQEPKFVREAMSALTLSIAQSKVGNERLTHNLTDNADFIIRAIISDQKLLPEVQRRGQHLWAEIRKLDF